MVMGWSNWIYLAVGLGLGVGYSRLSRWNKEQPTPKSSAANTEARPELAIVEQLKAANLACQSAQQMSQFKAGFLVRTSHELRSPLNSLIGFHQLILSDLCDDAAEEREFVAQAHELALKLVKLLDEILDVARLEHATNPLKIQPLQLSRVLEEVYRLTHLLAANRNLRLYLSPPDPDIYVLADPHSLRQVLVSLVESSITQMEEGSICISSNSPTDGLVHVWLDVQLSVSAWSQESVDLLQSESITKSELSNQKAAPSLGLTLILNQTLLELMKGRLEVLSISVKTDESPLTRIQVAIPLVIRETADLGQEGN